MSETMQRRARLFWQAARLRWTQLFGTEQFPTVFVDTAANRAATTPAMRARAEGYEAACHACEQVAGGWRFTLPE